VIFLGCLSGRSGEAPGKHARIRRHSFSQQRPLAAAQAPGTRESGAARLFVSECAGYRWPRVPSLR